MCVCVCMKGSNCPTDTLPHVQPRLFNLSTAVKSFVPLARPEKVGSCWGAHLTPAAGCSQARHP